MHARVMCAQRVLLKFCAMNRVIGAIPALFNLSGGLDFDKIYRNRTGTDQCICAVQHAMHHQGGVALEGLLGIPEMLPVTLPEMLGMLPEMAHPAVSALLLGSSVMTGMPPEEMAQHPSGGTMLLPLHPVVAPGGRRPPFWRTLLDRWQC